MDASPNADHVTLSRFIMTDQKDPCLTVLMTAIQTACKVIAGAVRKAGIAGLYGLDGSTNSTGDDVKKLDILANDTFISALLVGRRACFCLVDFYLPHNILPSTQHSRNLAVMVSEENEEPIIVESHLQGKT